MTIGDFDNVIKAYNMLKDKYLLQKQLTFTWYWRQDYIVRYKIVATLYFKEFLNIHWYIKRKRYSKFSIKDLVIGISFSNSIVIRHVSKVIISKRQL